MKSLAAKRAVITASVLASTAAASYAVRLELRDLRARLSRNTLILNETLPVHSLWWREHAKLDGELLYVAMGDSAAQGIGATAPNRGYVGLLADDIRATTGRTVRVVNLSVSGATVALAVADQLPRFEKLKPDIVTVAIGANDIVEFDAARFESGLRRLFAALPDHAIVADLPYFYLPWNERKVKVANGILRRLAAEFNLTVAPLYRSTKHHGIRGILTTFAKDFFHPNDRGYLIWQSAFAPLLVASVAERFPAPGVGVSVD